MLLRFLCLLHCLYSSDELKLLKIFLLSICILLPYRIFMLFITFQNGPVVGGRTKWPVSMLDGHLKEHYKMSIVLEARP